MLYRKSFEETRKNQNNLINHFSISCMLPQSFQSIQRIVFVERTTYIPTQAKSRIINNFSRSQKNERNHEEKYFVFSFAVQVRSHSNNMEIYAKFCRTFLSVDWKLLSWALYCFPHNIFKQAVHFLNKRYKNLNSSY